MTSINGSGAPQSIDSALNILGADEIYKNREELIGLFEDADFYNEGNEGGQKIAAKISQLNDKIEKLEKEAQDILNEITDKEGLIQDQEDELVKTGEEIFSAITTFEAECKKASRNAASEAISKWKSGDTDGENFEQVYENAFKKHATGLSGYQQHIGLVNERFEQQRALIGNISGDIEKAISDVKGLNGQLENVQGTISMLARTKSMMEQSTVEGAYQNVDTNEYIPHYSGVKAEVANGLLEKYTSRYIKDAGPIKQGIYTEEQQGVMAKWTEHRSTSGDYVKTNADGSKNDIYSMVSNPEVANLCSAIEDGMLEELQASGMGVGDIMNFITSTWQNSGIKKVNNSWSIPYGHGAKGTNERTATKSGYQKIHDMLSANSGKAVTADDVNPHQLQELQKAVLDDQILKTMYENGFTFKEAMYTLIQLFPDAGIGYELESQAKGRNYSLPKDSNSSGGVFGQMATYIEKHWGVKADGAITEDPTAPETPPSRHDPFTFETEDGSVTLIIDRDKDGKFDYNDAANNELLGSQAGIEELLAFDTDGDMKLTAEELQAGGVMFMVNNQKESVANETDVDNYWKEGGTNGADQYTNSVDFNTGFKTAEMMGVDYIDLNGMVTGTGSGEDVETSTKNYDGTEEAFEDINGSSIINTFDVKFTDGKTIEGKETLNTTYNLDAFYGKIAASQEPGGENANSITVDLGDSAEDLFDDGVKGSKKIDDVLDALNYIKDNYEPEVVENAFGVDLTTEDIQRLTGQGHISGIKDAGAKAAARFANTNDRSMNAYSKGMRAATDAVGEYFDEEIYTESEKKKLEEDK